MAGRNESLGAMKERVHRDGYRLGEAWRQEDGLFRVEAWKEGAAFQVIPLAGVGKTEREALADLLRTLDAC